MIFEVNSRLIAVTKGIQLSQTSDQIRDCSVKTQNKSQTQPGIYNHVHEFVELLSIFILRFIWNISLFHFLSLSFFLSFICSLCFSLLLPFSSFLFLSLPFYSSLFFPLLPPSSLFPLFFFFPLFSSIFLSLPLSSSTFLFLLLFIIYIFLLCTYLFLFLLLYPNVLSLQANF